MKKILFISTFLLVILIAIGCASAADVEANDGMIDDPAIANAMFHGHGVDIDGETVHPDDSGIVDNRTVPNSSGIIDNNTAPDAADVDNKNVLDKGGHRNNDSNSSSSKYSSMDLEDIINNDYDSHVEGIYVTNPDLDMCIVDSYGYGLIISYVNALDSYITMGNIYFKNIYFKLGSPFSLFFNFNGKKSVHDMIPDYIECPNCDADQIQVYSGNFLCLG